MNKIIALSFLLMSCISSAANASNTPMSRYLRHEINTDELCDYYCPRSNNSEATVYHSDGSKSLIRSNNYDSTIYHGNGSKSLIKYTR